MRLFQRKQQQTIWSVAENYYCCVQEGQAQSSGCLDSFFHESFTILPDPEYSICMKVFEILTLTLSQVRTEKAVQVRAMH